MVNNPLIIDNFKTNKKTSMQHVTMISGFVMSQVLSGFECFIAEVAGDDDSFQMICFNVIFYSTASAFLSTHFAPVSQSILIGSVGTFVLTFLHH